MLDIALRSHFNFHRFGRTVAKTLFKMIYHVRKLVEDTSSPNDVRLSYLLGNYFEVWEFRMSECGTNPLKFGGVLPANRTFCSTKSTKTQI